MQRYGVEEQGWIGRHGFWPQAFLWLPAGSVAPSDRCPGQAVLVRFGPDAVAAGWLGPRLSTMAMEGVSLVPLVSCGVPLALGCRRLWRLDYRRGAWTAGVMLGAVTVAVTLLAGLLGLVAITVCAVAIGLPVWIAWCWLALRG